MQLSLESFAQRPGLSSGWLSDADARGLAAERVHHQLRRLLHGHYKRFQEALAPHALVKSHQPLGAKLVEPYGLPGASNRDVPFNHEQRRAYEWPLPSLEWPIPSERTNP